MHWFRCFNQCLKALHFLTVFSKLISDKNNESLMDAKLFKDYIQISFK
jgi:hypothetical protein